MAEETTSAVNQKPVRQWDVNALKEKILELQDQLVQAQEKNILLSAQTRELERVARDADDLKTEVANMSLLLADRSKENKNLHQELARVTTSYEQKLQELEELTTTVIDVTQKLKTREFERDQLAVMLNEVERDKASEESPNNAQTATGWFRHIKGGKKPDK